MSRTFKDVRQPTHNVSGAPPEDGAPHDAEQVIHHLQQALDNANRDVSTLRTVVKTLEKAVSQLQADKSQATYELQDAKHYIRQHEDEIKRLSNICEAQTATIQRMAMDHADEMVHEQQTSQKEIARLRAHTERLSGQLTLSNGGPRQLGSTTTPQALPWNLISKQPTHPIHIVRKVILSDQRREELGLVHISPELDGEDDDEDVHRQGSSGGELLDALLEERSADAPHSEDDATWRNICRRLHQVLSDRRRVHHLLLEDTPTEFLLRSRSIMVTEWVALQSDLARLDRHVVGFVSFLESCLLSQGRQAVPPDAATSRRLAANIGQHLESLTSSMSDIMVQCSNVREHCFSEVDKMLHS
ncbi:unnamed protein product [Bodo saltans]|uniref:Uncharacterized protein n=1 Tax=Bodo saltans TaxID=75058 RepID=A0A0S4KKA8_BODSA|nr:unnamed protein product [Bodo saltans]|eukprot:CUI15001.1 unnamed protein product [Bodo saltans]